MYRFGEDIELILSNEDFSARGKLCSRVRILIGLQSSFPPIVTALSDSYLIQLH